MPRHQYDRDPLALDAPLSRRGEHASPPCARPRRIFRSPELRRVELAFAGFGFNAAEWGVCIRETRLYALDKASFLASVTGHPRAAGEAERLVRERLPSQQATIAP